KMLDEKIPGNRFEIGRIKCGRKKQKRIKKKMKGVRSWVMFLEISEGDLIILVPSLKALGEAVQPIEASELIEILRDFSGTDLKSS
ncbi:MAG: hypothetical protein LUG99_22485, partial [Lachnospiraceae bacterium]|nr:hypothetical protein [Lachnospiraceae bacterium]